MIVTATPQFQPNRATAKPLEGLKLGHEIITCIQRALDEDIGTGDVTTNHIVSATVRGTAQVIAKQDGVVSGLAVAQAVFLLLSSDLYAAPACSDGNSV